MDNETLKKLVKEIKELIKEEVEAALMKTYAINKTGGAIENGTPVYIEPEPSKPWKPEDGDPVYVLNWMGIVAPTTFIVDNDESLHPVWGAYYSGNVAPYTPEGKKKLEDKAARGKVEAEIKRWKEVNDPVKLDWENLDQKKWEICYSIKKHSFAVIESSNVRTLMLPYFSSKEKAEQCISDLGDKLNGLLGGGV